ncbi:MAG: aminomethyl-transferring glycine dehydrogenase subunit GcvPA [Candidatus Margulisiibacteriota bacterium]|nr:MAG: glycine dehydrogenase (aminomethyl-transferring) [Candidatus Margulisbacteria bacterium GWD2_39_127]OGI05237.1 MAG: glycine dehydrogenase (aminomethyl-transferring) [Candidatus Margulisbacteria bacterium GWF2_38_17]OGI06286.1 MAG: glycine dehydrogenase (aminomethyl-transferring) [Candidatus Margulisbacteria bacterium GWE2_39_32]PZM78943.1 MAG: aminomethyl-transferring glycine dehydrogenase subunit GcvPA [Candidatus Margulisiibacteriota bacterium]HAR64325.1 aminomethyl-transferring glyci
MKYSPITEIDKTIMFEEMKITGFSSLVEDISVKTEISHIPDLSEMEVKSHFQSLIQKNIIGSKTFLGAGAYNHYIPSVINHIAGRSEYYTAYTPYQPEISQGTLQAIFEFQSMICSLTGMDIANASMYDGATAVAEAAILACSSTNRSKIIVSETLHPEYIKVLETYLINRNISVEITNIHQNQFDENTAAVVNACPDFFGVIKDYRSVIDAIHSCKGLYIAVADPISLALLESPGKLNADIVVGEGQPLGIPISFGGPYLGFMAAKKEYLRLLPGRIIGATIDKEGKQAFVLTFQTREQHIRREKATSNICSNQALCALRATLYMALMGDKGMTSVAQRCLENNRYFKETISKIPGFHINENEITYKEFVLQTPVPAEEINKKLLADFGMIGGLPLSKYFPERNNEMLICTTEILTFDDINQFVSICKSFAA